MNDPTLHDVLDRIDTGLGDHPDLVGIMAAGRRQRRRTRAAWAAAGAATALAVVAPLAVLLGGTTTAPAGPGFATQPGVSRENTADAAAVEAAVRNVFPAARADASTPGTFALSDGVVVEVTSGPATLFTCEDCSQVTVGDQDLWISGYHGAYGPTLAASAVTPPVAAADGSAVQVMVEARVVGKEAEPGNRDALPSDDDLARLAADDRLTPQAGWTGEEARQPLELALLSAAVEERIPGLRETYATYSDGEAGPGFVGASGEGSAEGQRVVGAQKFFEAESGYRLFVGSATDSYRLSCPDSNTARVSCTQVGDRTVRVSGLYSSRDAVGGWSVMVYPTDPSRTEKVEVNAFVSADSWEEAKAKTPSVEVLREIALDQRLTPPSIS